MVWAEKEHHHFKDHYGEARVFARRVLVAFAIVLGLFLLVVARYYHLQVTHYQDYVTLSDKNRIQVRPVSPNRGLVYDSEEVLLAYNRPSFTLSIVKERSPKIISTIENISKLIRVEDTDKDNFYKFLKQRRRPYEPTPLRYHLTEEEIALLAVNKFQLQGVEVQAELVRYYPKGNLFAHALGYVGRINEQELRSFDEQTYKRYSGTHSIGKIGLEKYYEDQLLGKVGYEYIESNAHGQVLRVVDKVDPVPGKDLHLFLNARIQSAASDAMQGQRGAVVAIDIETGGVVAMLSAPTYDPNLFVTGISFVDYDVLNQSAELPLLNRTVQGQYPPGSTIKPILGLGGLEYGTVTYETKIADPGFYQLENDERLYREWKEKGHGDYVDLRQAIVESCDIYFYDMAFRMGVDRMYEFGRKFGLGQKTQIDIPSERAGLWPSRAWKKEVRGTHWYPGDSLNMTIGQGDVLVTPLQLASMAATLASRGEYVSPRLVNQLGGEPSPIKKSKVYDGYAQHWDFILAAMKNVVHSIKGTANVLGRQLDYQVAGKTGTAQVVSIAQGEKYDGEKLSEFNRDHALFMGFAPAENPKIALAVIVENGEHHSNTTFPVVKSVFDAYLNIHPGKSQ